MTLEEKKQHDKEISDKYLLREEDITEEEYAELSIQDMCVLINNAKWLLTSGNYVDTLDKMDDMKGKIGSMHRKLIAKIMAADVLYTVTDRATGYPFITEINDSIWIFSKKEYADECVEHYKEERRAFQTLELKGDNFANFLGRAFYTNGVGGIFVDNGQTGYFIAASDLIAPPSWEGFPENRIPVTNPDFMRAHLKLSQELGWKVEYNERRKVLEKLENDLVRASKNVRFLVPTKGAPESKNAADIRIGEGADTTIPMLIGKDGVKGLPIFTDWDQFHLLYSDKEYHAWVMDFKSVTEVLHNEGGFDSIVVNVKSRPLDINKNTLKRMEGLARKLEERAVGTNFMDNQ